MESDSPPDTVQVSRVKNSIVAPGHFLDISNWWTANHLPKWLAIMASHYGQPFFIATAVCSDQIFFHRKQFRWSLIRPAVIFHWGQPILSNGQLVVGHLAMHLSMVIFYSGLATFVSWPINGVDVTVAMANLTLGCSFQNLVGRQYT